MRKTDHASRDQNGRATFYVLLWKRSGISQQLFGDYWRNVHGPVCARLPGQHQYWQYHLAPSEGGLWPTVEGIDFVAPDEAQFEGIAELTFRSEEDRRTWFTAAAILMDDEHNLFSKAIGYNTAPGNSRTYVDGIEEGAPNGAVSVQKLHVLVQKAEGVSREVLHGYLMERFAPQVAELKQVLKFRLHLFEKVDNSRPDAAGVSHREAPGRQYQAAFEIAFSNRLEMEEFFASEAYANVTRTQARYIQRLHVFPERTAYTFVYDDQMTLAGQRGSTAAELIRSIGAVNQLRDDVTLLMLNGPTQKSELEGVRP
jgi:EthD domain-containing protein